MLGIANGQELHVEARSKMNSNKSDDGVTTVDQQVWQFHEQSTCFKPIDQHYGTTCNLQTSKNVLADLKMKGLLLACFTLYILMVTVQGDWMAHFKFDPEYSAHNSRFGEIGDVAGIPSSWGGNITIADNGAWVTTQIQDLDGNVFFKVSVHGDYCIINAGVNLNTNGFLNQVHEQNGLSCAIRQSGPTVLDSVGSHGTFFVGTLASHLNDCKWNGVICIRN
jgi:hypothetical protein